MTWQTLRNAGYLMEIDNLKDGPGIRNTRNFLQNLAKTFVSSCIHYYDKTGELPFIYRERQINSIILPSIAKVSDAVFMEQPIKRQNKQKFSQGWLDYWVLYGTTALLIELKHSWCSVKSNKVRKVTQGAWSTAIKQLDNITEEQAEDLSITSNTVKIAMMVVPFYKASTKKENLTPIPKEGIMEIHCNLVNKITSEPKYKPNWSCIWSLHEKIQKPVQYDDGRYELYPCVSILVRVNNDVGNRRK